MAILSPPFALGAAGQLLSGKLLRLSQGVTWRPSTAALGAVSGVIHGPAGTMMELTLVNQTTVRVNPGVAVIQGTHSGDQGQYEVPNDAAVDLTLTGQDASQFRRSLIVVEVADSQAAGVASSATTDRARVYPLDGPLSATSPAPLPTLPANTLALGEVAIPPTGQTVTLTPYNPRTGVRGSILPVFDDALTYPGHGGESGAYVGQYRDHATWGLQRWSGSTWLHQVKGPWIRGKLLRTDNTTNLNANSDTNLTMQREVTSSGTWTTYNPGNALGYTCTDPGRYLLQASLRTTFGSDRWESLFSAGTGAQVVDDDNANAGFSGLAGSLVIDAPSGISVGLRFTTNAATVGTIRDSHWSLHWLQPL